MANLLGNNQALAVCRAVYSLQCYPVPVWTGRLGHLHHAGFETNILFYKTIINNRPGLAEGRSVFPQYCSSRVHQAV